MVQHSSYCFQKQGKTKSVTENRKNSVKVIDKTLKKKLQRVHCIDMRPWVLESHIEHVLSGKPNSQFKFKSLSECDLNNTIDEIM